jgi:hypothetical protein
MDLAVQERSNVATVVTNGMADATARLSRDPDLSHPCHRTVDVVVRVVLRVRALCLETAASE